MLVKFYRNRWATKIFWCWIFIYKAPFKQWTQHQHCVWEIQVLAAEYCCLHELVCGNLLHLRLHISHTVVLWKSAHGRSTLQVCQTVGLVLFQVVDFNHERVPVSCLQWFNGHKANNWAKNNVKQSHQWLCCQVMIAHNILNGTMSPWTWCSWWSMPH